MSRVTRMDAKTSERARMLSISQTPMFMQMSAMDSPTPAPRCVPKKPRITKAEKEKIEEEKAERDRTLNHRRPFGGTCMQLSPMDSPAPPPECLPLTPPSTSKKRKRPNPKSKSPGSTSELTSLSTEVRSLTRRLRATERELDDTKQKLAAGAIALRRKDASRAALSAGPQLEQHILMLFVGPNRDILTLHTNLLPQATQDYLRANTNDGFSQLPSENWEIVDFYRTYLYSGKIHTECDGDADLFEETETEAPKDAEWHRLVLMYLLGKNLRDESFVNKVIDALVEKVEEAESYPTGMATEVYENTKPNDKLRRLIVDLHVWLGRGAHIQPPHEDANGPASFMNDVLRGMVAAGGQLYYQEEDPEYPWVEETSRCAKYHQHVETDRCFGAGVIDLTSP